MPHPKYGERYTCFECGTKFYTMKKPEPICPKCGTDQRKAPKKSSARAAKAPIIVEEFDSDEDPVSEDMDDDFPISEDEGLASEGGDIVVDDVPEDDY